MADKLLKSITFPDLADKYIVGDTSLSVSGAGADAKATGDALATKANIDGSYDSMTVGNAEQLVSNVKVNDKTPYLFRTSGGSVDIGDREYVNGIVGGTVAWNQLVQNGNFASTDYWVRQAPALGSISASGNVLTHTITGGSIEASWKYGISQNNLGISSANHKFLAILSANPSVATTFRLELGGGVKKTTDTIQSGKFTDIWAIDTFASYNQHILFYPQSAVHNVEAPAMTIQYKNVNVIDLTQMFGSTIADYIYSLEQANAGAGVAWFKKLFNKPYYAYNAGELKHVSGLTSHDMTGFNACPNEWKQGDWSTSVGSPSSARVSVADAKRPFLLGGHTYCLSCGETYVASAALLEEIDSTSYFATVAWTQNGIKIFTPTKDCYCAVVVAKTGFSDALTPQEVSANANICVNLSWDGSRNGEYEPYELHSYPLDSDLTLRGIPKLDANNSLYYDGDVYESDGTVTRKYGIVDLGTLTWTYNSTNEVFSSSVISDFKQLGTYYLPINMACAKYVTGTVNSQPQTNKEICTPKDSQVVRVKDLSYSDATAFTTAMNGVYLVYELATPTTETADAYVGTQIVNDFGTEEYVIADNTFAVPVGHDTDYPVNLVAKLEMAPNSPEGNGDYIVRQVNGENSYVPLVIEDALPTIPSETGSYKLTVTVAEGSDPVLSWEAE